MVRRQRQLAEAYRTSEQTHGEYKRTPSHPTQDGLVSDQKNPRRSGDFLSDGEARLQLRRLHVAVELGFGESEPEILLFAEV